MFGKGSLHITIRKFFPKTVQVFWWLGNIFFDRLLSNRFFISTEKAITLIFQWACSVWNKIVVLISISDSPNFKHTFSKTHYIKSCLHQSEKATVRRRQLYLTHPKADSFHAILIRDFTNNIDHNWLRSPVFKCETKTRKNNFCTSGVRWQKLFSSLCNFSGAFEHRLLGKGTIIKLIV